jgi:hypothetical protein
MATKRRWHCRGSLKREVVMPGRRAIDGGVRRADRSLRQGSAQAALGVPEAVLATLGS